MEKEIEKEKAQNIRESAPSSCPMCDGDNVFYLTADHYDALCDDCNHTFESK